MAKTFSNMLPLGTKAPSFKLLDTVLGTKRSLNELKGLNGTIVMFICNHCPYVIHINQELVLLAKELLTKGIKFIAISSNDTKNYPQDGPIAMGTHAKKMKYFFPYLYDKTQQIAKAYDATCTPDFYLFNSELKLTYRGQIDDSRPGNNLPVNGSDLRHAVSCLLKNKKNTRTQKPSVGCSIKWKLN
jgi:thiol-disulfide isomerase/thioredoxin